MGRQHGERRKASEQTFAHVDGSALARHRRLSTDNGTSEAGRRPPAHVSVPPAMAEAEEAITIAIANFTIDRCHCWALVWWVVGCHELRHGMRDSQFLTLSVSPKTRA